MLITTIIPTIGRPTLARAVDSVLSQALGGDALEVIVVNDSGNPLPQAPWQEDSRVRVIDTQRHGPSVARNTGAALARGRYLYFLDDDDHMRPGAFQALCHLAQQHPEAAWLCGATQLADREDRPILVLRPNLRGNRFAEIMAWEWVPLQSSFFSAQAYFAVGGHDPHLRPADDIDFCRRLALHGDMVSTDQIVACVRVGAAGSSLDYDVNDANLRWSRDQVLARPGAFRRLVHSARTSPDRPAYLHGHVCRIYWTTALWNLRRGRLAIALSRALHGLACLALSGRHLAARAFWIGLLRQYVNQSRGQGVE